MSISYAAFMSICDVFNVRNGTGEVRLVALLGYVYFEPKQRNATACMNGLCPLLSPSTTPFPSAVRARAQAATLVESSSPVFPSRFFSQISMQLLSLDTQLTMVEADREALANFNSSLFYKTTKHVTQGPLPSSSTFSFSSLSRREECSLRTINFFEEFRGLQSGQCDDNE